MLKNLKLWLATSMLAAGLGYHSTGYSSGTAKYTYNIMNRFPHDPNAFTQGLFFLRGHLYESTGIEGQSTIRRVRLSDGAVLKSVRQPSSIFGEGIVNWKREIISVTWRNGIGFRWDLRTLQRTGQFSYSGEGWGLTQNGKSIILSDGSPTLRFFDPVTMRERRRINVTANGKPLKNLNELEWVKGEVLANVWQSNVIVRIDPTTGVVKSWIDFSGLVKEVAALHPDHVLNGIAYDKQGDRLFVTGKNWPYLYEIRIVRAE